MKRSVRLSLRFLRLAICVALPVIFVFVYAKSFYAAEFIYLNFGFSRSGDVHAMNGSLSCTFGRGEADLMIVRRRYYALKPFSKTTRTIKFGGDDDHDLNDDFFLPSQGWRGFRWDIERPDGSIHPTTTEGVFSLGESAIEIAFPLWAIIVVFSIPALIVIPRRMRRSSRKRHGLCLVCGYDLRMSPGLCPECGTKSALRHSDYPSAPPSSRLSNSSMPTPSANAE